ncbi:MAG: hypothetical protein IH865_13645 [Chloroflexi bacterium]|nr:hypothetical protein [Chloroflexota bacterium]
MDDATFEGIWWIPGDVTRGVAGNLIKSVTDFKLSLTGSFTDMQHVMTAESYPLVLGVAKGAKQITLLDCVQTGANLGMPGFVSKVFMPRAALVGGHLEHEEALRFPKATFQYSYLPDWVGASGFDRKLEMDGDQLKRVQITYEYPEEITTAIPGGEFAISYGFETGGDLLSDATLRQNVHVRIELEESLDLVNWFSKYVEPLQNLLTLATGRPNAITGVRVYSPELIVSTSKGDWMSPLEVLFTQDFGDDRKAGRLYPHDMLFTLGDLGEHAGRVINDWLQVAEELDSVCNLFFGVQYGGPTYLRNRFLPLVQAVESYHRRRKQNYVLRPEAHEKRVEEIVANASAEHREWLGQNIGDHTNEPSLRTRLKELVSEAEEIVVPLIAGSKKKFIDDVVNTRHYLTHFDEELREKAAQGEELFHLSRTLSFIVQACLLGELGLEGETRTALFKRNQPYLYAVRQAKSNA